MATRKMSFVHLASTGLNALFKRTCISSHQQLLPGMDAGVRKLQTTTTGYKWQKEKPSEKRNWTPKFVRGASKLFKDADAAVCVISEVFFQAIYGMWP